ncbi:hypothetical protein K501DRAFT_255324 [Backusella circina FSU 941]|nr:hypothetical protein K501DRAFT_255324 [Backusella circina FSU 941]
MSYQQSSENNTNEYYPIGQDAWNRSKESREHPELHSTGHGTMSREWDTEAIIEGSSPSSANKIEDQNKDKDQKQDNGFGISFGHTTRRVHSPRSIKRDLNNI